MPTYDYRCKDCKKTFSLVMTLAAHDKAHPVCPKCQSKNVDQKPAAFFAVGSKKS